MAFSLVLMLGGGLVLLTILGLLVFFINRR